MIDRKHTMKMERAWRAFETAARDIVADEPTLTSEAARAEAAQGLLSWVERASVEQVIYSTPTTRYRHARELLIAIRDRDEASHGGN